MTLAAGKHKQCSDVSHFSNVIKFDVNTDIRYFAHVWVSPVVPPNPCYSHSVQELKNRIVKHAKEESRGMIL